MTSFERLEAALMHREGDHVPLALTLSIYGAKELEMPVKQYFSRPENVVKAQLRMRDKYKNDMIYSLFYAPIEIEAFGGEVIFMEEGPPNSGEPLIKSLEDIQTLQVPRIEDRECLRRVLTTTQLLKEQVGESTPIIGVAMSPFSLPVMQMGFEKYLELLYFRRDVFDELMRSNEQFCVNWANAQLNAGATAICYFNPLASATMIERELYLATGYKVDKRTLAGINGLTITHLASGIALSTVEDIINTGTSAIGFSSQDNLEQMKKATQGKICLLGNLNAIEMVHWDSKKIHEKVAEIITKTGKGGGLILSDNHGEIPWQVSEDVLLEISEAVQSIGRYPIE